MSKRKPVIFFCIALVVCAGCLAGWIYYSSIQNGPLTIYGNVDIRTVQLSFRVGGKLEALHVDEGDTVSAGLLLGHLDKQPYKNSLKEAQASLMASKAQLAKLVAGFRLEEVAQARAEVAERRTSLGYAEKLYQRQLELLPSRAVSSDDVDNAKAARDRAKAALAASEAKLALYESGSRLEDIEAARAALMQSEAVLAKAELNLADTDLIAPAAGVVLTRAVEPGTILGAGNPVFSLSLTSPVWVRAYVDGSNLSRAVPGTKLNIFADHRAEPYKGSIGFVSPTAEFTPKSVQTPELRSYLVYRLRIIVEDPDDGLRQGMPVSITFDQ